MLTGRRAALWGLIGVVACVWSVAGRQAGGERTAELASVRVLIEAGRYVEAEEAGLKLVAESDARPGAAVTAPATSGGPVEIAEAIDLVLEARWLGRRLTQPRTVEIGERALAIKEAAYGADDVRVATTLVMLGLARSAHRDGDGARTAAERAIAIRERTLGPNHVDVAAALNALGWIERIAARYEESAVAARRALDIARRAELASSSSAGPADGARDAAARAAETSLREAATRDTAGPEAEAARREIAAALTTLGLFERHLGRSDLAVPLFEEALAIDERRYGPDHPALVSSIQPLAAAYWDAGDADKTRSARERMIRLLSAPGSEYRLAFELVLLGGWLVTAGDYSSSLIVSERAVQVAERATSPTSALSAAALEQLALAHSSLNDHAAAAAIRRRTVALWRAASGDASIHTAAAWKQLAESYEEAGDIDAGLDAVERALVVPALTKEPIVYPEALQAKARLLMSRGRLAEARAILEQARQVGEHGGTYSQVVTDLGITYRLLARIERQDGRPARAIPLYREGLRLYEGTLGPANPTVASWRTELAAALAEAGQLIEARQALQSGEQQSLDHLRLLARTLTDRAALKFAASRMSGLDLAVTLAADRRVRIRGDIDTAWDMVIHGRTVILDEMAARQRAVTEESANATLRDRWTTLNRTRARLANLIVRGPADQPADVYQALVDRTRADRDGAERDLAQASVAFRHEQQRSRAGLREVMATLPADAAVIAYVRYTPQPVATPTSARGARARHVKRTDSEKDSAAPSASHSASAAVSPMPGVDRATVVRSGTAYSRLRAASRTQGAGDATITRGVTAASMSAPGAARSRALVAADSAPRAMGTTRSVSDASDAQGVTAPLRAPRVARAEAAKDATTVADAAYAAFIARAGRPVTIVPLGSAARIEAAIDTWRGRIRDELSSAGLASRRTETTYREAGAALRSLIWDPVQARLAAASSSSTPSATSSSASSASSAPTFFVVPDGALHLVDLATLPTGRTTYLVDAPFVLHYLLAERDLLLQPSTTKSDTLLALGAPNFDKADRAVAAPPSWTIANGKAGDAGPARSAATATASACDASFATRFDPLPSTRDEVLRIAELWQRGIAPNAAVPPLSDLVSGSGASRTATRDDQVGPASRERPRQGEPPPARVTAPAAAAAAAAAANATRGAAGGASATPSPGVRTFEAVVLGGVRATETAFKSLARGRRVLHIATHGFFLDRFCAMSSSASTMAERGLSSTSGQRVLEENPLLRSGLVLAGANRRASAAPQASASAAFERRTATSGTAESTTATPNNTASTNMAPTNTASTKTASTNTASGAPGAAAGASATPGAARIETAGDGSSGTGVDDDDGILTAEEIAGLDLSDAQWAVLSACDTGRGDWQAGEGVLGLRRAFQVAGARTVILSLWPVLDTVTSTWMTELYRDKFVAGRTTAAAVREANRTLLAARRAKGESTHPLYWSGFIATGDWR